MHRVVPVGARIAGTCLAIRVFDQLSLTPRSNDLTLAFDFRKVVLNHVRAQLRAHTIHKLPPTCPPHAGGLPTAYPVGPHPPGDCSNIWRTASAALSSSISTPTSVPLRPKYRLRSGSSRTRCATDGLHFSTLCSEAPPSRNSSLAQSASTAAAIPVASDWKKRHELTTLQFVVQVGRRTPSQDERAKRRSR
jgi:hypothetical protein